MAVYVSGYTTKSGKYVAGYWRSSPNDTVLDNYSTKGNVNPFTGEIGTVSPTGSGVATTPSSSSSSGGGVSVPSITASAPASGGSIIGGAGADKLYGMSGNDVITGNLGDDYIDGGKGIDIAKFLNIRSSYTITPGSVSIVVSGPDGVDTLTNIERLQFSDGTLVVDSGDPTFSVYRLYEAALNRAPDGSGLTAWTAANTNGMSMTEMARQFMAAPEFVQRFGSLDNAHFVDLLYRNVLDRPADAAGASGWVGALNSGQMSREIVLLGFADSAENIAHVNASVGAGIWIG